MEYIVEGANYSFNYQELREDYYRFKQMTDMEFIANIAEVLHFACFVCFLKNQPTHAILSDKGIIHQLVHLLNPATQMFALNELGEIRDIFNKICELA